MNKSRIANRVDEKLVFFVQMVRIPAEIEIHRGAGWISCVKKPVSNLEGDTPSFRENRADPASLRYAVAE